MSELLKEARCYVADALEAHEHSDGRDLLNRIDAALRAEPGWQPISSAPRDGTDIIVWFAPIQGRLNGPWKVSWENIHGERTPEDGIWCVDDNKHGPYPLRGYVDGDDTHWRPLPAPPVEAASPTHAELSPGNSSDLRGEEG